MKAMDLKDRAARPMRAAFDRTAYKARFMRLIKTDRAKQVACNTMGSLMKACRIVSDNGGAASGS